MKRWTYRKITGRNGPELDPNGVILPGDELAAHRMLVKRIYELENKVEQLDVADPLPCPSCGSEKIVIVGPDKRKLYHVECPACGKSGMNLAAPALALRAWNCCER